MWIWGDMAIGSGLAQDGSCRGLGEIVDQRSFREGAEWPGERIPKSGPEVLALCATPCQLDHSLALLFQQHGEQSALRKRPS